MASGVFAALLTIYVRGGVGSLCGACVKVTSVAGVKVDPFWGLKISKVTSFLK